MIIDTRLTFTANQTLGTTGTLTDSIDLGVSGVPGRDIGPGQPIYWVVQKQSATGGGTFTLESDEDSAFGSVSAVATITVPATAPIGSIFAQVVPPVNNSNERYLRVTYAGTAVTVASHLTSEPPAAWQAYDAPFQA